MNPNDFAIPVIAGANNVGGFNIRQELAKTAMHALLSNPAFVTEMAKAADADLKLMLAGIVDTAIVAADQMIEAISE